MTCHVWSVINKRLLTTHWQPWRTDGGSFSTVRLFPLQLGKDFNSQQTKFSRVCSSSSSVPLCRSEGRQSRYTFQQFNLVFAILTLFQDQEDQITTDLQTCNFQKASKLHCSHFWIKSQLSQFTRASLCVFLLNRLSKW